ncbi:hypothetical protein C8Q76DRAFT_675844 [Earliella scabrosa]|nr:hypothetical protein C8Q76DRAFT_675844 [Earliella scabrosa]
MSSSRSSSSSPEPEIAPTKSKKSKVGKKKKQQATMDVDQHGRNKGDAPDWDYKPPDGFALMKHKVDESDFDWDAIHNDDNLELWVVRVPEGLKPKHLEGVKLEVPTSHKTTRVGSIDRKHATYDVWSLGEDDTEAVGGDELRGVSCLLPRQKHNGKLYQAPKPFARRLVISARPSLPTPPQSPSESSQVLHQNPPRPSCPKELLKHRFMPLGSLAPIGDSEEMDVDPAPAAEAAATKSSKSHKNDESAEGPQKKRKGDVGSPKKKKAKTAP